MTIKLRLLLVMLLLQLVGFGCLLLYSQDVSRDVLGGLRRDQLAALFAANLSRIDAQTDLMERSVRDLALAGELALAQPAATDAKALEQRYEQLVTRHLANFPDAIGGGLWFEPGVVDPARRLFGPYAFWQDDEVVFTWDLSSDSYNYLAQSWYRTGVPDEWPRDRPRPEPVYWTEPYYDEAGSEALMMTVDAPMHHQGRVVGMATIDWSTEAMRELVSALSSSITPGAHSFLIEPRSSRFVTYTRDPSLVMAPIARVSWAAQIGSDASQGELGTVEALEIDGQAYVAHFMASRIGLVFGTLIPHTEAVGDLDRLLRASLGVGALIALAFLLIMLFALGLLFRPFNRVLRQISESVQRDPDSGQVELRPLPVIQNNEFVPILRALNDVYAEVGAYTERLAAVNEHLSRQRSEIGELNASLEGKVNERTFELESRNSDLQRTIAELQRTQHRLVEAEKHGALSRLVAGVAHEINTPLGIAVTASSHLRAEAERLQQRVAEGNLRRSEVEHFLADTREGLDMLGSNLDRAAGLVRSFKQISVDQSSEGRRRFELRAYLDDILLSLRPRLKRLPHRVEIDCPADLWLDSYPGAWSQIITNFIINSLIHGLSDSEQGWLRIEARATASGLRLRYADSGRGIPADNLDKVFDPFFTTNRAEGGSGLGLSVVYNLVTRTLGGQIECVSPPGQGAAFTIEVPLPSP